MARFTALPPPALSFAAMLFVSPALHAQSGDLAGDLAVEGPAPFDALPADAATPFGGLSLTPTRVTLAPGAGVQNVTLYNSGSQAVTYRIEVAELETLAEGGYAALEEGTVPAWSAARYLRYAPRQVTLQGGERQVIKVISTAPRDLPPGELRSHLRFSSIPTVAPVEESEDTPSDASSDTVEVSVGLEYRITIPVVLQTGAGESGTAISSARVITEDSGALLAEVVLERSAPWSDTGTVRVLAADGTELGLQKGVAVLAPLDRRILRIPIDAAHGAPSQIVFEREDDPEASPIATATFG